ncbi:phospholipase-like protein [Tanacetum coccineum]
MIDLDSDDDLVKDLSRYNRATDRVHLTDVFDIFLGRQGPLRYRFPWCKDVSVDRRFLESLVCLDPTKKGWIMDELVELWVNYMWHVRPHDADWAMVGGYFVQLLLQDSIPSWYADGTMYKVSWCDVKEVFMPINETDQHWFLAHLHIRTGLVTFYDKGVTYDPEWCEWYISLRECLKIIVPLLVWLVAPFCITQLGNNLVLSANYHVGDSRLLCAWVLEVDGHSVTSYRMIVSVPTPYSSRLLGFNMDEELIIEVDDIVYLMDTTLQVYHQTHEEFQNLGVEANSGSDDRGYGYFMWMDDFRNHISSPGPSTPPTLYTFPSTRPSYSAGTSRSAMNVRKAECSNELDMEVALEEEMLNLFTRFLERIKLRRSEIIRLGSQPDNPLVDHGRELLERLTGEDMRNAMQMMRARHKLQRSMAEKVVMITNYRQM